jgi:hypothetical protein
MEHHDMGSFVLLHWIVVIMLPAAYLFPIVRILRRNGSSGWGCVLFLLPIVNIFMTISVLRTAGYCGWWCLVTFVPIGSFILYHYRPVKSQIESIGYSPCRYRNRRALAET